MLALSGALTRGAFALIGWLTSSAEFFNAFGFAAPNVAVAFLLFGLLGGVAAFWLTPLGNLLARRYEYQADAFARDAIGNADPMVAALRKLTRENLSNLTPHPLFSGFYYSHPTLAEREGSLRRAT
jgi:STE24 endopeptidase